jgi:hypothetical protein
LTPESGNWVKNSDDFPFQQGVVFERHKPDRIKTNSKKTARAPDECIKDVNHQYAADTMELERINEPCKYASWGRFDTISSFTDETQ